MQRSPNSFLTTAPELPHAFLDHEAFAWNSDEDSTSYDEDHFIQCNTRLLEEFAMKQALPSSENGIHLKLHNHSSFLSASLMMLVNRSPPSAHVDDPSRHTPAQQIGEFFNLGAWAKEYIRTQFGETRIGDVVPAVSFIVLPDIQYLTFNQVVVAVTSNFYQAFMEVMDNVMKKALENKDARHGYCLELADFALSFDLHLHQAIPFVVDAHHKINAVPVPITAKPGASQPSSSLPPQTEFNPPMASITRAGRQTKLTTKAIQKQLTQSERAPRPKASTANLRRKKGERLQGIADPSHKGSKAPRSFKELLASKPKSATNHEPLQEQAAASSSTANSRRKKGEQAQVEDAAGFSHKESEAPKKSSTSKSERITNYKPVEIEEQAAGSSPLNGEVTGILPKENTSDKPINSQPGPLPPKIKIDNSAVTPDEQAALHKCPNTLRESTNENAAPGSNSGSPTSTPERSTKPALTQPKSRSSLKLKLSRRNLRLSAKVVGPSSRLPPSPLSTEQGSVLSASELSVIPISSPSRSVSTQQPVSINDPVVVGQTLTLLTPGLKAITSSPTRARSLVRSTQQVSRSEILPHLSAGTTSGHATGRASLSPLPFAPESSLAGFSPSPTPRPSKKRKLCSLKLDQ
ncbi:hypothetical protein DXG01_007545 [Tephrocybe rancida]|nr:hypothetical protein DXG01_007545 [Tephrocybe rancida]